MLLKMLERNNCQTQLWSPENKHKTTGQQLHFANTLDFVAPEPHQDNRSCVCELGRPNTSDSL